MGVQSKRQTNGIFYIRTLGVIHFINLYCIICKHTEALMFLLKKLCAPANEAQLMQSQTCSNAMIPEQ